MSAFDLLLGSPWLPFGLFIALVLAAGFAAWQAVARGEERARHADQKAADDQVFNQLRLANATITARRDTLETLLAKLPAGVTLTAADGSLLAGNPQAAALAGVLGPAAIRRLPDGRMVEVRRVGLNDGGALALYLESTSPPAIAPLLIPAPALPAIDDAAGTHVSSHRRRRSRVLLVEDIAVNQIVTATALRRDGAQVDVVASGAEGVAAVARTPYELVLMDLMMPGMSGFEAARLIRALPDVAGRVPIYALTATASQADRARCREAGMQGMLTKPVRPIALDDVLTAILQPRRFQTQARPLADTVRLIDAVRLAELQRGLPEGLFIDLVDQALGDIGARLGQLTAALADGAASEIVADAHAIAGIAGSYGLLEFERQMRRILAAGQAGDAAAARQAGDGMAAALDGSAAVLRAMLRPPPR